MVGNVEELRAELKADLFVNPSVLQQRHVQIYETRARQIVSLKIAERTYRGHREGRRVGVTVDAADNGVDARNDVGPLFRAISVSGLIKVKNYVPRRAARVRKVAAQLPPAYQRLPLKGNE